MVRKQFTDEEVAILMSNPYTLRATSSQVSFTKEFKQLYWDDYLAGMKPSKIFRKYGYDTEIIGQSRVSGFQQNVKKDAESGLGFYDGRRPAGLRDAAGGAEMPDAKEFREMKQRVDYLEKEIEFLKKISSARTTGKWEGCS